MFEQASKIKLRFATTIGNLSTEDLWDLPLSTLNRMAKKYKKALKENEEEDYLQEKSDEDTITKLRFDLVLRVLQVKLAEKKAREIASKKKEERQKLLGILAKKQDESLESLSEEELKKRIEELEG